MGLKEALTAGAHEREKVQGPMERGGWRLVGGLGRKE
jgi:hypothetical protein